MFTRDKLNEVYKELDLKAKTIMKELPFEKECGWFNGHYSKNKDGIFQMDYFPIPVISVVHLCDIEIGLDSISISAKLSRKDALSFSYDQISQYDFEVYGVENYLQDFYNKGMTIEQLLNHIQLSMEEEIGFSFYFEKSIDEKSIFQLIVKLNAWGFYY